MDLKPITRYAAPRYPTNAYLIEHPELLRLVPERWRGNAVVLAALGAATILMTATRLDASHPAVKATGSHISPVFDHGQGKIYYSGAAMIPHFLTEEEAAKIVNDEVKQEGLHFIAPEKLPYPETSVKLTSGALIPRTALEGDGNPSAWHSLKDSMETLDGFDPACKIGYDFLSYHDYGRWGTYYNGGLSGHQDFEEAAERLRESLADASPMLSVGVFYSPVQNATGAEELLRDSEARASWETYRAEHARAFEGDRLKIFERMLKEQWSAEYCLRLQVRDFIQWLKAQGII